MAVACVYLTVYLGTKLPPFYIGSAWTSKVKKGYRGSVASGLYKQIWYNEINKNPELFKTIIISYCKTRDEAYQRENEIQRKLNVTENKLYVNQYVQGVTHTEATRKKISKTLRGKCYASIESRARRSAKLKGIKRINLRKKVAQYTPNGELVAVYACAAEAAQQYNTKVDNITGAASGRYKYSMEFQWRYFIDEPLTSIESIEIKNRKSKRTGNYATKPIVQLSLKGEVIQTFNSIKEAAAQTGIDSGNIVSGIKGGKSNIRCVRGGYIWKYLK